MRIVTRPDFDGVVAAVLLLEAETPDLELVWMEPSQIQSGTAHIKEGDIIANLPWHPDAGLWFDHHVSNKPAHPVPGAFAIAPSAAGVIYTHYQDQGKLDNRFDELIFHTDMIDSADLTEEQVQTPENHPYLILSMTIQNKDFQDIPYWNRLVDMLRHMPIAQILEDKEVKDRCQRVIEENQAYKAHLTAHTRIHGQISVTDFRGLDVVPSGNRFLPYSLFPDTIASIKIRFRDKDKTKVQISVGHSIFNRQCRVNVGKMLAKFGGGGHAGAGGATLDAGVADQQMEQILNILIRNKA